MSGGRGKSKLSDFKILEQIGRGGFGVVYAAEREENGEKVAIKKIDRSASQVRVRSEIQTMKNLKHRNIVEFYEDFVEDGETYLVMELCSGGSLRSYVKQKGPLDDQAAVHILRQLVAAVTYMHDYRVLHRDLSAGNVFIKDVTRAKMSVKLGDFGLATELGRGETACTIVGTPGYIAPQVFRQDYDQAADVYSLGGVLYTMLTAHDPPQKGAPQTHGMSQVAADLVQKMMHPDARKRIQLREILMDEFVRDISKDDKQRSRDSLRRGFSSRDGRSQDRVPPRRSASQPAPTHSGRSFPLSNRPVNDRMPTTSSRALAEREPDRIQDREPRRLSRQDLQDRQNRQERQERQNHPEEPAGIWPIRSERLAGQRIRTPGGRYIVEMDTRCRFEVAAKGDFISRIIIVEYDQYRRLQTVFVHRIGERRERGREEGEDLIELSRNPLVYTELSQLPKEVLNDYSRLHKMVMSMRSRVAKITHRRPIQFPEAAAQLMENGDLRIKFSRSVIVRKVENGEIFNCIDGTRSKKEGVHGTTQAKVNEVFAYLTRFEQCLMSMGHGMTVFPIAFSTGANIPTATNNSPSSFMPSSTATSRFAFSNISNTQQPSVSQMPRSAPFLTKPPYSGRPASTDVVRRVSNDENSGGGQVPPRYKFKVDAQHRVISIQATDGRQIRRSTRLTDQFIFMDPAISADEQRFMRTGRVPERASELFHHLLERLKGQQLTQNR